MGILCKSGLCQKAWYGMVYTGAIEGSALKVQHVLDWFHAMGAIQWVPWIVGWLVIR